MSPRILTVPGWTGSGSDHWQTRWERSDPSIVRVEQRDWDRPDRDEWVEVLERAVRGSGRPVVLVAHSLGCLIVTHWTRPGEERVSGALLAAPPDAERADVPPEIARFAPIPRRPLPFPTIVAASRSDPYCSFRRAADLAVSWAGDFVDAGDAGHLNTASGHGPWPLGGVLLRRLLD